MRISQEEINGRGLNRRQFLNDKSMVQRYLESTNRKVSNPLIEISTLFNFEIAYARLILKEINKGSRKESGRNRKIQPKHYFNKHAQPPLARNIEVEAPVKQAEVNLKEVKPLDGIEIEWKGDNRMNPVDQRSYRPVFEE